MFKGYSKYLKMNKPGLYRISFPCWSDRGIMGALRNHMFYKIRESILIRHLSAFECNNQFPTYTPIWRVPLQYILVYYLNRYRKYTILSLFM